MGFLSIKTKLVLVYALILILTLIVFSAFITVQSNKVVTALAQQNVEQTILTAYQALNSKIDNINASMLSFQINKDVQEILCRSKHDYAFNEIKALEQALSSVDIFQTNIASLELYVLDRSDFPSLSAGNNVFSAEQIKNDVWFKNVLKQGDSTTWTVRNNLNERNSFIVVSKLRTDYTTDKPVAVLKANVNIQNFCKSNID